MRIINAEEVEVKLEGELVLHDLSFQLEQGELITVMGPSGCGKTLLGKLFAGMITHHRGVFEMAEGVTAAFVEQQDNFFAESGMRHTYYSQRYEYFEGRAVPTTADLLHINAETWEDDAHLKAIIESLKVDYLLDRQLLLLSNGERKRVQLVSAIMSDADLYIFDQPFLGLDVKSREILHQKLEELKANGKTIVLVGNKRDIPTCTDRIVEMKKGTIKQITAYQAYNHEADDAFAKLDAQSLDLPLESDLQEYGNVVKLTDVNIKSLGQPLLSDINWTIRDHERWLLSGHNGSGKSTLLSMITGDNPQVYTNDVVMFGKPRGSGESVWEIKQKIGFVSPELHLYFMRQTKLTGHHFSMQHNIDCLSVVVSGFNEEIVFPLLILSTKPIWQRNGWKP